MCLETVFSKYIQKFFQKITRKPEARSSLLHSFLSVFLPVFFVLLANIENNGFRANIFIHVCRDFPILFSGCRRCAAAAVCLCSLSYQEIEPGVSSC